MNPAPVNRPLEFDRLVAEHEDLVFRICRSILRDDHLGADAAQETFLRLWRRWRIGTRPHQPEAWLKKAAATSALDLVRRRRLRARDSSGEPLGEAVAPQSPVPSTADARDLARRLDAALAQLPDGQRTVFLLRHHGGLTLREVAETLGLALPTVKTQFARACLRLQSLLSAFRPGSEIAR